MFSSRQRQIYRATLLVALGLLVFHFIVYTIYAVNLFQFPFDYDQGEGFELVDTVMFSQGKWPYQSTEVFPFYSSNYPPLFHIIAAPFVHIFGTAYWYGRLLSFISTLITAVAIGYAVYRTERHKGIALLSGLAFLASNTVYHIGPLFRQHAMMVMFETLGVVVLAHVNEVSNQDKRRCQLALGLALIIAAGFTKQLAIVTALASGIFLLIRQPRRAVIWGLLAAFVGAAIFVSINIVTGGEWWRQAILANVNELNIIQTVALFRQWFGLHGFLIIPAILIVFYELYWERISIYVIWFVLALIINGAASGTWGGGDSYFTTAIAATCILSGIFVARTLRGNWSFPTNYLSRWIITPLWRFVRVLPKAAFATVPILYIGYGLATFHMPTNITIFDTLAMILNIRPNAMNGYYDSGRTSDGQYATGYANIGHLTSQTDVEAGWQIVDLIRQSNKPVISEDAGFTLMAARPAITNPTQLLNLEKKGLYSGRELVQMIDDQEFGLVILRAQFYPQDVLIAISKHYEQEQTVIMNGFNYLILRPKA